MATILDELVTIIGFRGDTRELDRVQQRIRQVESNINTMARNFGIAGAALTGVGFVVGRTILSFDRAMNTLRATFLDAPVEDLEDLKKQAMDLGAETSKSATDAANAQVELARAGLSTKQVMESIPDVLDLAIAGELDMAEAAGLVTNQLAGFRLETSETQRVVDVLSKTAVSARTTVGELGPAFRQVAPLAAGLGISIEQTAAVIGTLRSGGLIPEQAGTAFRNILAILQEDPTDKVRQGFQSLGLEFEEVRAMVSAGDIEGAIRRLSDAGLDTKNALAIFGREAAAGASSLAIAAEEVDGFIDRLNAAEGTTGQMREVMESGFPGSVDQFKSSLEGLQLALGDSGLRGLMTKALDTIRNFLRWITDAPGPVKTLMVAVIAAGPGLLAFGGLLKVASIALRGYIPLLKLASWANRQFAISSGIAALWNSNFILSLRLAAISAGQYVAGLGIAGAATKVFRGVMLVTGGAARIMWLAVTGPIGWIIAAFAALGYVVYRFRRQIMNAFQAAWEWVKGFFDRFGNYVLMALSIVAPFIGIPLLIARNWERIVDVVGGIWQRVYDTVKGWIDAIIGFIRALPSRVKDAVQQIPGMVTAAIKNIPVVGQLLEVGSKVKGFFGGLGKALGFAEGGMVPGPLGRPMLATVHGGEMVLTPAEANTLFRMLEGFRLGPAALPQAPPGYGQLYRSYVSNRTVNVTISEPIVIQTQATDARGIAQELNEAIQDQIRNVAYDHDGPVDR